MRLHLLALGERPPAWVESACADYLKRLKSLQPVEFRALAPGLKGRAAGVVEAARRADQARVERALPPGALVLLDQRGESWSTRDLAERMQRWRLDARDVSLVIGGAEGHHPELRTRADQIWSLSPLTLPHMLVRVIVLEQLYRAASVLAGHPYHREG